MLSTSTSATPNFYTPGSGATTGTIRGMETEEETARKNASALDISGLGKDEFMKLLLAQMQHQDPLSPADNTEFIAQLAQFSSLEQMTNLNENLGTMIEANQNIASSINNSMLVSYIGKDVNASSNYFNFDGETAVDLKFIAKNDILSGKLEVLNSAGTVLREISLENMSAGNTQVQWDGITKSGIQAASGGYYFNVTAVDILSNAVEMTPVFQGTVDGVTYLEGNAFLKVGEIMIPFDSVNNITEFKTETE